MLKRASLILRCYNVLGYLGMFNHDISCNH